jgi:ketosteroid isomerase-like protein
MAAATQAIDVVNRWRASNFERPSVEEVLAPDVEWVVPVRGKVTTLRGIDAVLQWYGAGGATDDTEDGLRGPENLDVSEERGELEDLGDGRVAARNKLIYTWKESGEVAYVKTGRLVYTVRDGRIVRYELEPMREETASGGAEDD